MKQLNKHINVTVLLVMSGFVAIAQFEKQAVQKEFTKQIVNAMTGPSQTLSESCRTGLFILKFHVLKHSMKVDSLSIITYDSSLFTSIDVKKLKSISVDWPVLLDSPVRQEKFTVIQPLVITGFDEDCGPSMISLKDLTPVWTLLSYNTVPNNTLYFLNVAEIKYYKPMRKTTE